MIEASPSLTPEQSLSSADHRIVEKYLLERLGAMVEGQGNRFPGAVALFKDQHEIFTHKGGQEAFTARFDALSYEEKFAFTRYGLEEHLAVQASHRIARLNVPDDRAHNNYDPETLMRAAKAAGKGPDYIESIMSPIWIGGPVTNHPTGYLDEKSDLSGDKVGVDLFLDMVSVVYNDEGELIPSADRPALVDAALRNALETGKLAPTKRATTFGENVHVADYAMRAIGARDQVLDDFVTISSNVYYDGKKKIKEPPNFSRDETVTDLTPRKWADYDGKPNAEHWTILSETAITTYASISLHLARLEKANAIVKGETNDHKKVFSLASFNGNGVAQEDMHPEFQELHQVLVSLKSGLGDILADLRKSYDEINDPKLAPEDRAAKFHEKEKDYKAVFDKFASIYEDKPLFGRTGRRGDRGLKLFNEVEYEFKRLRNIAEFAQWPKPALQLLKHSTVGLHNDGFTIFKLEPRHNHKVNAKIVDKLFAHEEFRAHVRENKILNAEDMKLVDQKFSSLSFDQQNDLMDKVENAMAPNGDLRRFLNIANPEDYDLKKGGYPDQTYGSLRRLEVMELYRLKFGPLFIIAESEAEGPRINKFIRSGYKTKNLADTPLPEEHATISKSDRNLIRNYEIGMLNDLQHMLHSRAPIQFIRAALTEMFPRSDIQKIGGWASGLLVYSQTQKGARAAANIGVPKYTQEGSGMSNGRGGGDEMVSVRMIAQALQEYQDDTGEPLPEDVKSMVCTLLYTTQGRETYMTIPEIARKKKSQISEIMAMRMELDGVIKRGEFIPQREQFRPEMIEFLEFMVHEMIDRYSRFRSAKGIKDTIVLDELERIISDLEMAKFSNNAARMASKSAGDAAEKVTDYRAIGSNIAIALSRAFQDEYFTAGECMEMMHAAYHNRTGLKIKDLAGETKSIKLNRKDIDQFFNSDKWNYNDMVRTLTPMRRAQPEKYLARVGLPSDSSDHDKLIEIGQSADVVDGKLVHAEGVTDEQALAAAFYKSGFSQLVAVNSILDGSFFQEPSFTALQRKHRPVNGDLSYQFNDKSLARWPFLNDVLEAQRRSQPALAVMDYFESRIKAGDTSHDEALKRQAASYYRASTVEPNEHITGDYSLSEGRRRKPLPENPVDLVANDNALFVSAESHYA